MALQGVFQGSKMTIFVPISIENLNVQNDAPRRFMNFSDHFSLRIVFLLGGRGVYTRRKRDADGIGSDRDLYTNEEKSQ